VVMRPIIRRPFLSRDIADQATGGMASLRDRAGQKAHEATEALAPHLTTIREVAAPRLVDAAERAAEWAGPHLSAASDQATTALREQVAPKVSAGIAAARERMASTAIPAREEAVERGTAALAALRGDLPARVRRWPRAVLLLGSGALAGAAAGLVMQRRAMQQGSETYAGDLLASPLPPAEITLPEPTSPAAESSDGIAEATIDAPPETANAAPSTEASPRTPTKRPKPTSAD
jgi:hypothetical protein